MAPNRKITLRPILLLAAITALLLSACGSRPTTTGQTPEPSLAPAEPTSAHLRPTLTPTAEQGRVLLITPGGSTGGFAADRTAARSFMEALAQSDGLIVDLRDTLNPADLTPAVKVVVILPTPVGSQAPDAPGLAAGAPDVKFILVGYPGIPAAGNLFVLGSGDLQQQIAFVAGYVAAITAPDWRAGVLSAPDPAGQAIRDGFLAGARYLCGICNPMTPPYPGYPVAAEAAAGDSGQSALQDLQAKGVKALYIPPSLASADLLAAAAAAGMRLIGAQPPPDAVKSSWTATVEGDLQAALTTAWPDVLAGKPGRVVAVPLQLSAVDSAALSAGKVRLVEQVMSDVSSGWIKVQP